MDKKQIRKEIAALINSIKEHSDDIGDKEHISQIELEVILNKIEKLYQKSIVFNHLHSEEYQSTKRSVESKAEVKAEPAIAPNVNKAEEVKKAEPIAVEALNPVDLVLESFIERSASEVKVEKKEEIKIEKKEEKPSVSKIQKPSLTDLRSAIGLNDKFQFSNELFEANIQEFEIAIQQLNTAGTLDSAMQYFSSLQQLYNWSEENETAKRLLELVERRYS